LTKSPLPGQRCFADLPGGEPRHRRGEETGAAGGSPAKRVGSRQAALVEEVPGMKEAEDDQLPV